MPDSNRILHVGIDLGTTNTLCAYTDEAGLIQYLRFDNGRPDNPHFLPSAVAFSNGKWIVGEPALQLRALQPTDVFTAFKENMGTERRYTVGTQSISAQDAAAEILREVYRQLTRTFPQFGGFHAFVTVPARYDTDQPRIETKEALRAAGFLFDAKHALTDEPIAASIAYGTRLQSGSLILVVDFGGGTFDLSLVHTHAGSSDIGPDHFEPLSWSGDRHLGGDDVDRVLVELMAKQVIEEYNVDLRPEPNSPGYSEREAAAAVRLRSMALSLKTQLFADDAEEAEIYADLFEDYDLDFTLTLQKYLKAVAPLTQRMRACIDELYQKGGVSLAETEHVLVVGGMAHEVSLQRMLRKIFPAQIITVPDESMYLVVRGAAIANSSTEIHVDNKAYASVGVLLRNGADVDVIIREGDTVRSDFHAERSYYPGDDKQWGMHYCVVSFTGNFAPGKYQVIFSTVLQLRRGLFKKPTKVTYGFSEDKLLIAEVVTPDGNTTNLTVRL